MTNPETGGSSPAGRETLSAYQIMLLSELAPKKGVIYVRGGKAQTALQPAMVRLVALGPETSSGALPIQITEEGRQALKRATGGQP